MGNIIKNLLLTLLIAGWFIATILIAFTFIGLLFLTIIDEWWEFPLKILKKIE